jgi:hypothetical protein
MHRSCRRSSAAGSPSRRNAGTPSGSPGSAERSTRAGSGGAGRSSELAVRVGLTRSVVSRIEHGAGAGHPRHLAARRCRSRPSVPGRARARSARGAGGRRTSRDPGAGTARHEAGRLVARRRAPNETGRALAVCRRRARRSSSPPSRARRVLEHDRRRRRRRAEHESQAGGTRGPRRRAVRAGLVGGRPGSSARAGATGPSSAGTPSCSVRAFPDRRAGGSTRSSGGPRRLRSQAWSGRQSTPADCSRGDGAEIGRVARDGIDVPWCCSR